MSPFSSGSQFRMVSLAGNQGVGGAALPLEPLGDSRVGMWNIPQRACVKDVVPREATGLQLMGLVEVLGSWGVFSGTRGSGRFLFCLPATLSSGTAALVRAQDSAASPSEPSLQPSEDSWASHLWIEPMKTASVAWGCGAVTQRVPSSAGPWVRSQHLTDLHLCQPHPGCFLVISINNAV